MTFKISFDFGASFDFGTFPNSKALSETRWLVSQCEKSLTYSKNETILKIFKIISLTYADICQHSTKLKNQEISLHEYNNLVSLVNTTFFISIYGMTDDFIQDCNLEGFDTCSQLTASTAAPTPTSTTPPPGTAGTGAPAPAPASATPPAVTAGTGAPTPTSTTPPPGTAGTTPPPGTAGTGALAPASATPPAVTAGTGAPAPAGATLWSKQIASFSAQLTNTIGISYDIFTKVKLRHDYNKAKFLSNLIKSGVKFRDPISINNATYYVSQQLSTNFISLEEHIFAIYLINVSGNAFYSARLSYLSNSHNIWRFTDKLYPDHISKTPMKEEGACMPIQFNTYIMTGKVNIPPATFSSSSSSAELSASAAESSSSSTNTEPPSISNRFVPDNDLNDLLPSIVEISNEKLTVIEKDKVKKRADKAIKWKSLEDGDYDSITVGHIDQGYPEFFDEYKSTFSETMHFECQSTFYGKSRGTITSSKNNKVTYLFFEQVASRRVFLACGEFHLSPISKDGVHTQYPLLEPFALPLHEHKDQVPLLNFFYPSAIEDGYAVQWNYIQHISFIKEYYKFRGQDCPSKIEKPAQAKGSSSTDDSSTDDSSTDDSSSDGPATQSRQ